MTHTYIHTYIQTQRETYGLSVFRQIYFADFAYNQNPCLSLCVCVYPLRKRMLPDSLNSKKTSIWIRTFQDEWLKSILLQLDLDLHFQSRSFSIFLGLQISHKRREIEQTLVLPLDRKSDNWNRMAPLRMLYVMTLTYIFKVKNFEM